jgi:Transglycosylase-like domain
MSRRIISGVAVAGAFAVFLPASPALADRADCSSHLETTYSSHYHRVAEKLGKRAPGRNIRKLGVTRHKHVRDATCHQLRSSVATLRQFLAPPTASAPTGVAPGTGSVQSNRSTGSAAPANLPACTWAPESGGSYSAYNSSSGAGGKYQIIPSTWSAYGGTGSPQTASPAAQERVAARVYAGQGSSAWTNC